MNSQLLRLAELMITIGCRYDKDSLLALGEVIKADIWTKQEQFYDANLVLLSDALDIFNKNPEVLS